MGEAKRIYAVVGGRGVVPFDMLRYDCCFPESPDDAATMSRAVACEDLGQIRVLVLAKYDKVGKFTPERWASFGWTCREFKSRYEAFDHLRAMQASM